MTVAATDLFSAGTPPPWKGPAPDSVVYIKAQIGGSDGPVQGFRGRVAWCLARLLEAGAAGITTLQEPAPRWSDYIFKLRKAGLAISTENERHGGIYRGTHGRYRLATPVEVLETRCVGDAL